MKKFSWNLILCIILAIATITIRPAPLKNPYTQYQKMLKNASYLGLSVIAAQLYYTYMQQNPTQQTQPTPQPLSSQPVQTFFLQPGSIPPIPQTPSTSTTQHISQPLTQKQRIYNPEQEARERIQKFSKVKSLADKMLVQSMPQILDDIKKQLIEKGISFDKITEIDEIITEAYSSFPPVQTEQIKRAFFIKYTSESILKKLGALLKKITLDNYPETYKKFKAHLAEIPTRMQTHIITKLHAMYDIPVAKSKETIQAFENILTHVAIKNSKVEPSFTGAYAQSNLGEHVYWKLNPQYKDFILVKNILFFDMDIIPQRPDKSLPDNFHYWWSDYIHGLKVIRSYPDGSRFTYDPLQSQWILMAQ